MSVWAGFIAFGAVIAFGVVVVDVAGAVVVVLGFVVVVLGVAVCAMALTLKSAAKAAVVSILTNRIGSFLR
ncbi:hypothetical protein RHSP_68034 [Rhizobium freirei PRF 81]|uniref:Transmembrane protein n=1 Tax=Rhizobium freirei PRF 81 TaxID=363754 RepID=N6UZL6_9HYPH|nr:hypothetical protein RHSP_68034 [Rhizobium freirei PRF 81]